MKNLYKTTGLFLAIIFILSCEKKPTIPVISTNTLTEISTTTVVAGGNITSDGGAAIVSRGVCWGSSDNPVIDNNKIDGGGSASFTCNITSLSPNTTYYIRAYATNSAGTGYGSSVSFKTLGDKPASTGANAFDLLTTAATLNGSVNPNSLATTVTFEYGLTTSYGSTSNAAQSPLNGNSNVAVSTALAGLTPGKTYHFRIKAENSLGITYSDDMLFTTLGKVPDALTQAATNIRVNTATINGSVNPNYLSTSASFEYGTTNYSNSVSIVQSLISNGASQSVSADISGLSPGTTYTFRIIATNQLGITNGNYLTFTTLDKPILTTRPLSTIANNSVTSGGNITADYGAPISERGLCWSTSVNPTTSDNKIISSSSASNFSVDLTGLDPNTTYYLRAYAVNGAGTGYGDVLTFKTFTGTTTDVDGNNYYTVTIGTQIWMASNLRTTHFRNGDPIPNITDNTQWFNLTIPACCYKNNDTTVPSIIGLLYNWYTTADSRNLCPTGWHVSTDDEWTTMVTYLGGESVAGGKMKMPGLDYWYSPNTGADNSSGFSGVSGGQRGVDGNFFTGAGAFWTSTPESATNARDWFLVWNYASVARYYDKKSDGFNIRCVKD